MRDHHSGHRTVRDGLGSGSLKGTSGESDVMPEVLPRRENRGDPLDGRMPPSWTVGQSSSTTGACQRPGNDRGHERVQGRDLLPHSPFSSSYPQRGTAGKEHYDPITTRTPLSGQFRISRVMILLGLPSTWLGRGLWSVVVSRRPGWTCRIVVDLAGS